MAKPKEPMIPLLKGDTLRCGPPQQSSPKAAISISEMSELCRLSRSRFYSLVQAGVFPKPVKTKSSKRPIYSLKLQKQCLEIRRLCIGLNGPVLFNRKLKNERAAKDEAKPEHSDLIDAMSELGLKTTSEAIAETLKKLIHSQRKPK